MPCKVVKRGTSYRIVEPSGQITKNRSGTAVDGGGKSKAAAERQCRAINASKSTRSGS